ncbi:hypothetical protein BDU57DRAFT_531419 [Ampelomyces quisqualis]|uniref:F-box domain-containing protein n=1 Tax=Ampelomyces quisqualis TaxID=50730 RepID=A0A6A5QD20_AMPQU|nr:hypothetical protein BDU57DRAFT_531419 [Ampelomyces quisqualis]
MQTNLVRRGQATNGSKGDRRRARPARLRRSKKLSASSDETMATQLPSIEGYVKVEDSPSPPPCVAEVGGTSTKDGALATVAEDAPPTLIETILIVDPRDPEGFLKRCSGLNKKTKLRCNSVIGKKSERTWHPTFLPTCRAHRDQQSFAGWCQYQQPNRERCSRLFRWTPPYFELCAEHQGHPGTPCYFFRLPLELRHEVFRYLLPDQPIGSSTPESGSDGGVMLQHRHGGDIVTSFRHIRKPYHSHGTGPSGARNLVAMDSVFPMPALDLFLVNRQFHNEAKDLLFSTVPFTIDVRKDGAFMCGRRLLEPRRADGTHYFLVGEADVAKQKFLKYFDWRAVKHYIVDVQVENGAAAAAHVSWDEEVELYDIRDYISVIVSGVLAKSRSLCKLSVRLCLVDFNWAHDEILSNSRLLLGPFESLRNVRQPQILGIFMSQHNTGTLHSKDVTSLYGAIRSLPALPTHSPLFIPGMRDFDAYTSEWAKRIATPHDHALVPKPPIRAMFAALKDFYMELSMLVPKITCITGRNAYLHLARVARENDNVQAMRALRNDLIACWHAYLDDEERKKDKMNTRLGKMLDVDIYPASQWEESKDAGDHGEEQRGKHAQQEAMQSQRAQQQRLEQQQQQQQNYLAQAAQQQRDFHVQAYQQRDVLRQHAQQQYALQARMQAQMQRQQQQRAWHLQHGVQTQTTAYAMDSPWRLYPALSGAGGDLAAYLAGEDQGGMEQACAQVGTEQVCGEAGPGPSSSSTKKKRRVDSGFSEFSAEAEEVGKGRAEHVASDVAYVGKGKGRMACWHALSWSKYHPQIVKLPWFSSMHLRKLLTSVPHAPDCCICAVLWCCCAKSEDWGEASAGADEEPPLKRPPMAWPMEDPTATPLWSCQCVFILSRGAESIRWLLAAQGPREGRLTQPWMPSGRRDRVPERWGLAPAAALGPAAREGGRQWKQSAGNPGPEPWSQALRWAQWAGEGPLLHVDEAC